MIATPTAPRPPAQGRVTRTGAGLTGPELARQRQADSAALRAARPGRLDLPYAAAPECRFDLFPAVSPGAPCLLLLHGGGWRGSRQGFAAIAEGMMAHGWSAALPGHSPVPEASLTRVVRQLHKALDWLAGQGPLHGIAGPVLLCGWGSGAHLAAMLLGHPRVTAGLGLSGLYDLGGMEEALGLSPLEVEVLSPQRLPVVRKPFAIAFGEAEPGPLRQQSRAFHALRQADGGAGPLLPLPGLDHEAVPEALRAPDGLLCHTARVLIEEATRTA
ncbi:alpha/beta hydrolase [Pseudoroseomonas cervicalis]|uniref:alpha/beta hydrolase n=1 Tax=Teichococcus cervicalis TaxID=204525 RepID=UPI0022F1CC93|nr:alpha/beta hydrolase [Pseudoroseomonas cervicalis]WBV42032.1 alpha/beta hydrolase [Pseudoroseomonas cervicalis]